MSSPPIPPLYPNRPSGWGPYDPTRDGETSSSAPPGESVTTLRLQFEVVVSPSTATPPESPPWWRRIATLVIKAAFYVAARYMP